MKAEKSAITYNIGQKWAVTLCCEAEEKLELRVAKIVEYKVTELVLGKYRGEVLELPAELGKLGTKVEAIALQKLIRHPSESAANK
jgi:hypothetical protein